jgi:hypothetical protein
MGIDALTTVEAGMRSMSDDLRWDFAKNQGRVIVTSDDDYLSHAASDADHNGLVFYAKDSRTIGEVIDWLALIHSAITPEEMRGHVEFVPSRK